MVIAMITYYYKMQKEMRKSSNHKDYSRSCLFYNTYYLIHCNSAYPVFSIRLVQDGRNILFFVTLQFSVLTGITTYIPH